MLDANHTQVGGAHYKALDIQPFEHHHALGARLFFVQHLQHLLLGFRSKDMVEITTG